MIPVYKIVANDVDITAAISRYLGSFRITDAKGYESDSFEMTLADPVGMVKWPTAGATLDVWIGFKNNPLVYKGKFVTDKPEYSGPPNGFKIKAMSADMNNQLKSQRSVSWHQQSLGQIVEKIASQNGLKSSVSEAFFNINLNHLDQTNESDLHFVTRLAKRYDATAKVAGGSLVFAENGKGKSASGLDMPTFTIHISETSSWRFVESGRQTFTGVAALWHSVDSAMQNRELAGDAGTVKTLKRHFSNKEEAQHAADAEFNRLSRDADTAEIVCQQARPEFAAECNFNLVGWRTEVATSWLSTEVSFEFSKANGLTSTVQLEKLKL